ncbi:hypothetical protein [Pseudoxanthomonas sp. 10H]|uniref:hypothetical protein n=1 Tax=Pseudoxanthomonas sp. 10H TaxID=3242729 RepID=UPI00355913D6
MRGDAARIALAALASMLAPPVLVEAGMWLATGRFEGEPVFALATVVVAAPHVLLLGVPAFLLLRRRGRLGAVNLAMAGFACGLLPMALVSWPYWTAPPGLLVQEDWHGHVAILVRDGAPTLAGVLRHLERMFIFGALGAACALVFWSCWRCLQHRAGSFPAPEPSNPP